MLIKIIKKIAVIIAVSVLFAPIAFIPPVKTMALSINEIAHTEVTTQNFSINSRYYLVAADSKTAATAIETSDPNSDKLIFKNFTGDDNQKWLILPCVNKGAPNEVNVESDNCFYFVSVPNQQCINAEQKSNMVRGFMYLEVARQNYAIEKTSDGYFTFQNLDTRKYLGSEGIPADGKPMVQMDKISTTQKWKIYAVDDELADKISISQIGFTPNSQKIANFTSRKEMSPPTYKILQGNKQVVSGKTEKANASMGVYSYKIDFSNIKTTGDYTIQVNVDHVKPVEFRIANDVYKNIKGFNLDTGKTVTQNIKSFTNGFFRHQRCVASHCAAKPGTAISNPQHYGNDTNIPIRRLFNNPVENVQTVNGEIEPMLGVDTKKRLNDASGGYHDATSNDKPIGSQAKLLRSFNNKYKLADKTEQGTIINEIKWAANFLCRVQKPNGAFYLGVKPQDPGWPERHIMELDGSDLACRVSAALAEASLHLKSHDSILSKKCLDVAKKGFAFYEANPTAFINNKVWPTTWIGNAGSILAAAVNLYQATGDVKYKKAAENIIMNGAFIDGVWSSTTGYWDYGQLTNMMEECMHGEAIDALCNYYPHAKGEVKTFIETLIRRWLKYVNASHYSDYGIDPSTMTTYFGACGWYGQVAEKASMVALAFKNKEAENLAVRMMGFVTGNNPIGSSYAVGIGSSVGTRLYERSYADSVGMLMPGIYSIGDSVTSRTDNLSISWKVGESSIDTTASFLYVFVALNAISKGNTGMPTSTSTFNNNNVNGGIPNKDNSDKTDINTQTNGETTSSDICVSGISEYNSITNTSETNGSQPTKKNFTKIIIGLVIAIIVLGIGATLLVLWEKKLLFFKN